MAVVGVCVAAALGWCRGVCDALSCCSAGAAVVVVALSGCRVRRVAARLLCEGEWTLGCRGAVALSWCDGAGAAVVSTVRCGCVGGGVVTA